MPRLRDGVIKRGELWSYVIRVPDPATGVTRPNWVGGFETEQGAKAARGRSSRPPPAWGIRRPLAWTVGDYLAEWLAAHTSTVKPKTLAGYRHDIDHYIRHGSRIVRRDKQSRILATWIAALTGGR